MAKLVYTTNVNVKAGRIVRAIPSGFSSASDNQREAIESVKPIMTKWLRSRIEDKGSFADSNITVRTKHTETSNALTIEFKIQAINPVEPDK